MALHVSTWWQDLPYLGHAVGGRLRPAARQFITTLDRLLTALGDGPPLVSGDADSGVLARTGRTLRSNDLVMSERERR